MPPKEEKQKQLAELARTQGGFFTAAQAEYLGFANSHQFRFVKRGSWERVRRGIYRLATEPENEREDLHILALFFRHRDGTPSGIFGLETAASIQGIGDFMPAKIFVLVGPDFRKRAPIPKHVELVEASEINHEVKFVGGLPVTSPLRTIVDLLKQEDRDKEEIRRAFFAARSEGIISPRMIKEANWIPGEIQEILKEWECQYDD